jgi:hypothetical protein
MLVSIYCLLMLILPADGHWDYRPIRIGTTSALMSLQEDEFLRWSQNEVERRSHLRQHLTTPAPRLIIRRVPKLSRTILAVIYAVYAILLFGALIAGLFAFFARSAVIARVAWFLIAAASAGMAIFLFIFGWPALAFVYYFVTAIHIFFAAYAFTILNLLKGSDSPRATSRSTP